MFIGQLAAESGFSKDTIRYYEKVGLIQSSGYTRQSNNYKNYSLESLRRLEQIRELKDVGFSLSDIVEMLASFQQASNPCDGMQEKLAFKIELIEEKISSLEKFKKSMQSIARACDNNCDVKDGLPCCITSS